MSKRFLIAGTVILGLLMIGGCPTIQLPQIDPNNRVPAADAGPDVNACTGDAVRLDASGSSDPDGDSLTYSWTQTAGPSVGLDGANSMDPSFVPETADTYELSVTVNDGRGGSASDTVRVAVSDCQGPDGCPDDPDKTEPGECGCGVADIDGDHDGTADCNDDCPEDPNKTEPGECGCGVANTDDDGDGTPNCHDGCPDDPVKIDPGDCGCGNPETPGCGEGPCDIDYEAEMNMAIIEHGPGPCENTATESGPSLESYAVTMPQTVAPAEQVTFEIEWSRCSDCNPNAVIYSSLVGDWEPADPLYVSDAYFTSCGETAVDSATFQAPTEPGEYRLRWILCYAFDAVRDFCGEDYEGSANDPGVCPYVEVPFTVASNEDCAPIGSSLLSEPTTFDGSNYLSVPDSASLNFGTDSFEVYVEFKIDTALVSGNRVLVMKGETVLGTGWYIGYGDWWNSANQLVYGPIAQMSDESAGGINLDLRAEVPEIYDGQWHSAKLVREPAYAVLYLDCAELVRVPIQNLGSVSNSSPVFIGRHNQPMDYHIGEIRAVIVRSPV